MVSVCAKLGRIFSCIVLSFSWIEPVVKKIDTEYMNGHKSKMKIDPCDPKPPAKSNLSRVEWQRLQLAANVEKVVSGGTGKATEAIQNITNQAAQQELLEEQKRKELVAISNSEKEKESNDKTEPISHQAENNLCDWEAAHHEREVKPASRSVFQEVDGQQLGEVCGNTTGCTTIGKNDGDKLTQV